MSTVFDVLEKLQNTSGTNQKLAILKDEESHYLKQLLKVAYDPFLQFYIKKIPVKVEGKALGTLETNKAFFIQLLADLSQRRITGNAAVNAVADVLNHCSDVEYKWYSRVLQKDLKIGLAEKSINKVFPKLIPTYEVMLADKIAAEDLNLDTAKALKILPDEIVCQYKIDGYRVNIHRPTADEVIIRTRNGKIVTGYNKLENAAKKLPVGYVYDGEIVAPEVFGFIQENTEAGYCQSNDRDLFNSTMSHVFSKEDDKPGIFNVFDVIALNDWQVCKSSVPYSARLAMLDEIFSDDKSWGYISKVPTSRVFHKNNPEDLQEIVQLFHKFINIGWEGLMIKDYNAAYAWKRTKALLKMKLMDTLDLSVLEVYEGTGKFQGMVGGVYVDYKGNKLGVGSGFTDSQRHQFWENPNLIVGKTIEIAYQSISHNKDGKESVSFPVFKSIRNDK